ncbi:MAG: alanine dehydrogenase [Euryarchaeota archaeon]|nr:alanine dehydrogenase [Euryarchaeota archaeon]
MRILWLSGREMEALLEMGEVIAAVEEAFREHGLGRVQMPPKVYLYFEKGDLRAMPAYIPSLDRAGVKIVNVHPENPSQGLPTVMASYVLVSPATGQPLAVMNATYLTDARTGAAGAIAAKYLARQDSRTLGLVGAGRQARAQLLAIAELFDLERVLVASRTLSSAERFAEEMGKELGVDIKACEVREACGADIVTTTTPSRKPVVRDEWIREGTHINAIGADAPGKQELDPKILRRAKIVVDAWEQAKHSGEINVPLRERQLFREDIHAELGEVVAGKKPGRESDEEITVFDSTGLAIQDVAAAALAYRLARERGIGRELEF